MISEDRLKASIDQTGFLKSFSTSQWKVLFYFSVYVYITDSVLLFKDDSDALLSWDDRIRDLCQEVTN